jgi:hypothetical protein
LIAHASVAAYTCRACRAACPPLLDAGCHPIANRFLNDSGEEETVYPLVLGQCAACGLIQSLTPVPVESLVPPYDWITYQEPESHLDATVEAVADVAGVTTETVVAGVTYKDDSTLARFERRGVSHAWRLELREDLGITTPNAGIETVQARLRDDVVKAVADRRGPVDVLILRHVLEHVYDLSAFVAALERLVKPGGHVVMEVPDCTLLLETRDYTMLWEEHVSYFTPATFQSALRRLGLEVAHFACHPYPYENSLVAVVRTRSYAGQGTSTPDLAHERQRARCYAAGLAARRDAVAGFLARFKRDRGPIALFGAGHLACMFVNLMGVGRHLDCVIDDHPAKKGLLMPGSRLPIYGSDALWRRQIAMCLATLSPQSEEKVAAKQAAFLARGGVFASVFPASPRGLQV